MFEVNQEVFVGEKSAKRLVRIVSIRETSVMARYVYEHESLPDYEIPFEGIVIPTAEDLKAVKAAKVKFRVHASSQKRAISEIKRAIPDVFEVGEVRPSKNSDQDVIVTLIADNQEWSKRAYAVLKNYSSIKVLAWNQNVK